MDLDQGEALVPQEAPPINGHQEDEFSALVQDYLAYSQPAATDDAMITDDQGYSLDTTVATWQPQTQSYMMVEYDIESLGDSSSNMNGVTMASQPTLLSSTRDIFNVTVGQSRRRIGLKDYGKMLNEQENNYFKALKWSPDGSCLLSASNDNNLRVFALPNTSGNGSMDSSIEPSLLEEGLIVREGEAIYDMCWYPGMTTQDPSSCCFLSSSRDHPVHLWDAYTGELRCSYTIVDHCEVNVAPNSLSFNLDGSKIYCGLNNMIEVFDTTRPGRDSTKRPTTPTRRSKKGQKGVISCLTFNPDGSGLYAAGSYSKSIGLYDSKTDHLVLMLKDRDQYGRKKKHKAATAAKVTTTTTTTPLGGITQLQFSPDGHYLYSASRQDPWIRCWDIRNTTEVLFWLRRPGPTTNQRISFDISSDGRWLTTGDALGGVSFFDLSEPDREQRARQAETGSEGSGGEIPNRERYSFIAHEDIVCSATFNPVYPILATCSGQRKYQLQHSSFSATESDSQQVWYVDGQRWEPSSEERGATVSAAVAEETVSVISETSVQASSTVAPQEDNIPP
ncbi:Telomerase Cajal body protein 1 [Actinomortierella wolfii]|nr:Telomerase Cajal body protein 1 [Actinomortierella wolfii]